MSKYTLVARIYPAILTGIPIVLISIPIVNSFLDIVGPNQWIASLLGNISFSSVILFFYSLLIRTLGKFIFEKIYFRDELKFPTTELLHPQNNLLSSHTKNAIYEKINHDCNIDLRSINDDIELRKSINELIAQIRIKVGKGTLLLQHNIEYGFVRNLCGGALVGFLFSVVGVISTNQKTLSILFISLASVYLFLLLISKWLISRYGYQYGKVLVNEYLSEGEHV